MSDTGRDGEFVDVRAFSKNAPAGLSIGRGANISTGRIYYTKGIVSEYISNPANFFKKSIRDVETNEEKEIATALYSTSAEDTSKKIVSNPQIARFMPANSIIAYIDDNESGDAPVIAYPFFPPYLSLPIKPGEHVWILVEEKGENNNLYYWMSRIATDRQVDDLNYTNIDRTTAIRELNDEYDVSGKVTAEDLLIPAVTNEIFDNPRLPRNISVSQIHAQSVAYREEFISEPVPRTFCKSSDLLLQGSNNTCLQFTTEKFRETEDIIGKQFLGSDGDEQGLSTHTPMAGALDLFVGKEKTRLVELSENSDPESDSGVDKFNVKLSKRLSDDTLLESYETSKIDEYTLGEENELEGDDSPRNVFSRLYLGMNASPDESFEFLNTDFPDNQGEFGEDIYSKGASAVLYSDHIRSYAEKSLRLHVYPPDSSKGENSPAVNSDNPGGALLDITNDGTITLQTGQGDKAAKIILKSDGNIVIRPGANGVLHLGGDIGDRHSVAVGVENAVPSSDLTGQSAGLIPPVGPIYTTMGGQAFLGDPASGYTSSKVLIKI